MTSRHRELGMAAARQILLDVVRVRVSGKSLAPRPMPSASSVPDRQTASKCECPVAFDRTRPRTSVASFRVSLNLV